MVHRSNALISKSITTGGTFIFKWNRVDSEIAMKIAVILGTRPEIIKMSPVIRECERQNEDYFILHTGKRMWI